ncbi:MAG: glycosyl transferase, partial [Microbacterium sp.]|nr:glycosyl transferase [Microbacterium sp.]
DRPLRVFVTLGTIRPYRFDRAVDAILPLLRKDDEVAWQLGDSMRDGLPGDVHDSMPNPRVRELIDWADVVVTHAGVGSIVDVLDAGKAPVIATRSARHNEHVDDHQQDIAGEITERGLGVRLDLDAPHRTALLRAADIQVGKA